MPEKRHKGIIALTVLLLFAVLCCGAWARIVNVVHEPQYSSAAVSLTSDTFASVIVTRHNIELQSAVDYREQPIISDWGWRRTSYAGDEWRIGRSWMWCNYSLYIWRSGVHGRPGYTADLFCDIYPEDYWNKQ